MTSIENLSDYILIEVFKYLNPKSLKDATLVCKKYVEECKISITDNYFYYLILAGMSSSVLPRS